MTNSKLEAPKTGQRKVPPQPLRGRYISPLEKKVGAVLDKSDLQYFGRCFIKYIRQEAEKDAAKTHQVPTTEAFYKSFSYRVKDNVIEVSSSWPWIEMITQGVKPHPMPWLTQAQGVYKVPLRDAQGMLVIRSTPLTTDKAWIHPGIARHTFIERAFRRAQRDCISSFLEKKMAKILSKALK